MTPTSLYVYYDERGVVLYVGITSRGHERMEEHWRSKEWWPFVVRNEVRHFWSRPLAVDAERAAIKELRPVFNIQHNPERSVLRPAYLLRQEYGNETRWREYLSSVVEEVPPELRRLILLTGKWSGPQLRRAIELSGQFSPRSVGLHAA